METEEISKSNKFELDEEDNKSEEFVNIETNEEEKEQKEENKFKMLKIVAKINEEVKKENPDSSPISEGDSDLKSMNNLEKMVLSLFEILEREEEKRKKEEKEFDSILRNLNKVIEEKTQPFTIEQFPDAIPYEDLKRKFENLLRDKTKKLRLKITERETVRFFNDEEVEETFEKDKDKMNQIKEEIINLLNFKGDISKIKTNNFEKFKQNILDLDMYSFSEGKLCLVEIFNGIFYFEKQIKSFLEQSKKKDSVEEELKELGLHFNFVNKFLQKILYQSFDDKENFDFDRKKIQNLLVVEQIENLKREIDTLKKTLHDKNSFFEKEKQDFEKKVINLNKINESQILEIKEKEERINLIIGEKNELNLKINELNASKEIISKNQIKINQFEDQIKLFTSSIEKNSELISNNMTKIKSLEDLIEKLNREIFILEDKNVKLNNSEKNLKKQLSDTEETNKALQMRISEMVHKSEELHNKHSELVRSQIKFEKEKKKKMISDENNNSRINELKEVIKNLEKLNHELKQNQTQLKSDFVKLQKVSEDKQKLEELLNNYKTEILEQRKKMNWLEDELNRVKNLNNTSSKKKFYFFYFLLFSVFIYFLYLFSQNITTNRN